MSRLHIETPDGRTAFEPGETVEVTVLWKLDHEPKRMELRIVWNTAGMGMTDFAVVHADPFEIPSAAESRHKTITLPQSPYSFSGQLISLIWALELVAFPSEESSRTEITIAPAGRVVRLSPVTDHTEARRR